MNLRMCWRLILSGQWVSVASIFSIRNDIYEIQFHPDGTATHINAIFWFGFPTQKKIHKSSLPKYGPTDSVPLYDVDNDCENDWCLWKKTQNKNAYAWLNKYNRKVQS